MADFDPCYEFMMDNEDAGRKYACVPDAPVGAFAISGINSVAFPEDFARIKAAPQAERGPLVKDFYRARLWNAWLEQLNNEDLAARVFDAAVNMGAGTAVRLLQYAVGATSDSKWGPQTVGRANAWGAGAVDSFKSQRRHYYEEIIKANPVKQVYATVWFARAAK